MIILFLHANDLNRGLGSDLSLAMAVALKGLSVKAPSQLNILRFRCERN